MINLILSSFSPSFVAVGSKAPGKSVGKSPAVKKTTGSGKGKFRIFINFFTLLIRINASIISGKNYSGGNPYHPRETPEWQKPITCFLNPNSSKEIETASFSQIQVFYTYLK